MAQDIDRAADHVRTNGRWAEQKLEFLDRVLPPALVATRRKWRRVYVDLFAGPGKWKDEAGVTRDGSALRALTAGSETDPEARFTHAYLVNIDPGHTAALRANVGRLIEEGRCRVPLGNIRFVTEDANVALRKILRQLGEWDYVFLMADIEAPRQWPWTSVEEIRAHGHRSIDYYFLFPLHMALLRMLPWNRERLHPTVRALDAFFGPNDWRPAYERLRTSQDKGRLITELSDLYVGGLREKWKYVDVARKVGRTEDQLLYYMLFASDHGVAKRLLDWDRSTHPRETQLDLLSA